MITISIILLAFGAGHVVHAGWRVSRTVPRQNEDMVFF
jgi:hypothetical protein